MESVQRLSADIMRFMRMHTARDVVRCRRDVCTSPAQGSQRVTFSGKEPWTKKRSLPAVVARMKLEGGTGFTRWSFARMRK